ncbi:MAG: 2-amino-4-hydroxy-6-hydroxymethyldihydropteridine diphosphokinase [Woeseiaceae bacterium]|nr:2-amino-4-hydroxy-6-hydroxymethyldihydropteridine diphosphokinase [Woeseiaceae bacterium]
MSDDNPRRQAFVGIGSNLDNPAGQVARAMLALQELPRTDLAARSSLYRSAPLGPVKQPDFVNAVAQLDTGLDAAELLRRLQAIERRHGRERAERWGPRVIDLDLLVYADEVIDAAGLTVPHPGIAERNFVLLPLQEIAPDLIIPGLGKVADIGVNSEEPRISRID